MKKPLQQILPVLIPVILSGLGVAGLFLCLTPAQVRAQQALSNSLIWPISGSSQPDTDDVSSPFGPRWQTSQNRSDYHSGLDIAAPVNTPVHVITDGIVTEVGWLTPDSGLTVIVSHTVAGYSSAYLHLNSTPVSVGQVVNQGEIVGYVGNSGTTEFMHLHLEIRLDGQDYPNNTRNPMGYLPRPEVTTPTIQITDLSADPIYSPTVSVLITATRAELDVNQLRVILQDRTTGQVVDEQYLDFDQRIHTGEDDLNQDGIQLIPSHFHTTTLEYELSAYFYQLLGMDSFTLTAEVTDLAGNTATAVTIADDTTPPGQVTDLTAHRRVDDSIDLVWTAPGDSGLIGAAAAYDIRYANAPIDSFTWYSATPLPDAPIPLTGGNVQIWNIPDLWPAEVYFALKTMDIEGNLSLLSNSPQALWLTLIPLVAR
jgi:hypothetical protein